MKEFVSPQGNEIIGTLETVPGVALIDMDSASLEGDTLQFDYDGQTDIQWNEQKTVRRSGHRVFVDDRDNEFTEDQLHFIDLENGITTPTPVFPDRVKPAE
ncbi:hypothetical protein [Marinobacter salsuginis]|jgi:hypothetical protein|uniref:Uncharacterized protein n=1 Tax=Marinobacter salsuginis TaxID=418719 RepID=A0A5M3Q232_9GAMM|nr:hypothetical protein [Marinobacter salsuginis]GBO88730.1 hypothetical protein MSSD14B_23980 [Marinobacter salsuginis]